MNKDKEFEAEPVMIMVKHTSINGEGFSELTMPIPKGVFDKIINFLSDWEDGIEMTYSQFERYKTSLDNGNIEEARNKLKENER